jgi:predicted O-linked N-acetylglucosamine transferase (SPINDLY family)
MGTLQGQPDALIGVQRSDGLPSAVNDAAWLDGCLASAQPPARALWQGEEMRSRLRTIPFELVVSAIERAKPAPGALCDIVLYRDWIEANPTAPLLCAAWFNIGIALARNGDRANAAIAYRNCLVLRPDLHAAAVNLGLILESSGQTDEALAVWERALQPDDVRVALGIQRGRLLETLGRFPEAESALRQVLSIDPAQPDVIHHWVHLRQKSCHWPVTPDDLPGLSAEALLRGAGPLGVLALTDDVDLQREACEGWVARKTQPAPRRLAPASPYGHARIRIGYLSSDFCSHAMSYLITELFERHDRSRFEVFGYCASKDDGSQLRQRVIKAFDHYRIIRDLADEAAAQTIRNDEIDVLVDLNGITDGSRTAVLRWKPAPIQATYLGFIGPLPMPELDFVFCDRVAIPPEHEAKYRPKPLPIAAIYQVNDTKRTIGRSLSRAEAGLPEDSFILCCFSRHYKITEAVFAAWMLILQRVDRAVLWLAVDNPYSQRNLLAAAGRAGIDAARLIFSERADPDLYLSRLALADLFLDTFPYNAGTVASDAMRMQLPMVTLCGAAFASRMATSLLRAIGANQGITTSLTQYVETVVRLARDREEYARYKALFTAEAWAETIGNIEAFTAAYETTLLGIVAAAAAPAPEPVTPPHAPQPLVDRRWADTLVRAISTHQAGDLAEAERLYRIVLLAPLAPAIASFNLGLLCLGQARLPEAADAFRRAIAIEPGMVNAIINLGTTQLALGRPEEAVESYRRALSIQPENALALGNLGKALQDLKRLDEAAVAYHAALALQPDNAEVLLNLGAALLERRTWADAVAMTRRAIALRPDAAIAYANLGVGLLGLGEHEAALAACRKAIALGPQGAAMACTLGGTLLELGEAAEAQTLCESAVAADPAFADAHFNLSHARKSLNQLPAAEAAAEAAVALRPGAAVYHFHLAHILLLQGKMERGWMEYEWRWGLPDFAGIAAMRRSFPVPQWAGEDIGDKTILVYTEQGLGDIIQFCRYLPLLTRRARRVILAANPATRRILETIPGLTVIAEPSIPQQSFDVHCPLLSLPGAFGTRLDSIPATGAYLQADPVAQAGWAARIGGDGLRVGIVWAGNPATMRDRFRSPRLRSVAPLFALPGITFVALQMGPGRADCATTPLPAHVVDLGEEIGDLTDTAAIMAGLDLVISSCTAPLHLAGALGVPSWGMIPFAPHFPWLLERTDTLWYPRMRLYRQGKAGEDWSDVVSRIGADLRRLAATGVRRSAPVASGEGPSVQAETVSSVRAG